MISDNLESFFDQVITVKLSPQRDCIDIVDQTLLPGQIKRISLHTKEEVWEAIKKLRVRGAPAIGVCAALGLAVIANKISADDFEGFYSEFRGTKEYLASPNTDSIPGQGTRPCIAQLKSLHAATKTQHIQTNKIK